MTTTRHYHFITPLLVLLGSISSALLIFWREVNSGLVWDWLGREGAALLVWWALASLAGVAALPILFRLLPGLPSRGYALGRSAGLMLTGFVFWYLASLGLWQNTPGAIVLAWLLVLAGAAWVWRRGERPDLRDWWRHHGTFVLVVEIVFVALFFAWAVFRAHEPEIRSTEKPMEMMFVNSIRASDYFPPNDAWLAGYAISYYYFGYVIIAGLADLGGVNSGLAFGMTGPLLFALTGVGVLGLVYDLVRLRAGASGRHGAIWMGLLGIVLLLFMGNLGAFFVEMPWNGRGRLADAASIDYFEFWGVPERANLILQNADGLWEIPKEGRSLPADGVPPAEYVRVRDQNANGIPDWDEPDQERDFTDWDYWWWFRYSRVVQDRFLDGRPIGVQPIAEVPHFSFVLSDIHPHVLALPFTLLALTLAAGVAFHPRPVAWWGMVLLAVWVGGMVFMNSWDAVFIPFLIAAEGLRRLLARGRLVGADWLGMLGFGAVLGVLIFLFYFPWIFSFNSQAGGFYFNIIWNTAPQQLFLQFGGFLLLIAPFLALQGWRFRREFPWGRLVLTFALVFGVLVVAFPFAAALLYDTLCSGNNAACQARAILFGGIDPASSSGFWGDLFMRRLPSYLSQGALVLALVFIAFRLFGKSQKDGALLYKPATGFAMLTISAGFVLILAPDFIYLIDNFRVRINTVFKLYYQAWIFLSVGTAYGVYFTLSGLTNLLIPKNFQEQTELIAYPPISGWRLPYVAVVVIVVSMGLVYPYYAPRSRALDETGRYAEEARCQQQSDCLTPLTLDGRHTAVSAEEYSVIECLQERRPSAGTVVAEAPFNGGYNATYGRVSMLTGIPTLLGWINHEGQWRGASYERVTEVVRDANGAIIDSREMQIDQLYRTADWAIAERVINRYGIDYVMVGAAEFSRYSANLEGLEKFAERLTPVCTAGEVVLYAVGR